MMWPVPGGEAVDGKPTEGLSTMLMKLDLCLMEIGLLIKAYSGVWHARICILIFCT